MRGYTRPRFVYQNPSLGDGPKTFDRFAGADRTMAIEIHRVLQQHYGAHFWRITADHRQGIATITLPDLVPSNWKYVIHLRTLYIDPSMRAVVKAAGEILERYGIRRGRFDPADVSAARDKYELRGLMNRNANPAS